MEILQRQANVFDREKVRLHRHLTFGLDSILLAGKESEFPL